MGPVCFCFYFHYTILYIHYTVMEDLAMVCVRDCSACFCREIFYNFGSTNMRMLSIVQLLSCVQLFATPWTTACQATLSFSISWNLLRFMSIESVMLSSQLILNRSFLPLSSIFPSIRVFYNELALHIRWPSFGASASVFPMSVQG